jgi:hypothetical protein
MTIRKCLEITMVTSTDSTNVRLLRRRVDGKALDRLHLICFTFSFIRFNNDTSEDVHGRH